MHVSGERGQVGLLRQNGIPRLLLLDINMPKKSGLEVLEWTRQQPRFKSLPVLMLTSSSRPGDRKRPAIVDGQEAYIKYQRETPTRGKRKAKVVPLPWVLSQVNSPCIASTSFLTMLKPKPVEGSPPVGRAERRP